jgi:hypothetical protein
VKVIDQDGDLETFEDQVPGVGWEFTLDLEAGEIDESQSTTDEEGVGFFLFTLSESPSSALLSEELEPNFEFLDAFCFDFTEEEGGLEGFDMRSLGETGNGELETIGELEGTGVRFDAESASLYVCVFFNAPTAQPLPSPSPAATPNPSPSPTMPDSAGMPASGSGGSGAVDWMVAILFIGATIAAATLLLRPPTRTAPVPTGGRSGVTGGPPEILSRFRRR